MVKKISRPDAATGTTTASEINIDVIQGIIKVVVADYIDSIIDATWESYAMGDWEYMDDGDGNLYGVIYTYDEGSSDHIYEGVEEACYDKCGIDLYEWKMENDIEAEFGGTVTAVNVAKGDSVLEGAAIVTIA